MPLLAGNLFPPFNRISDPRRGHVEKESYRCSRESVMPNSPEAEKASSFYREGPAALAAEILDADIVKPGNARSQVVERHLPSCSTRREALTGQDTLNKTSISEYPLVTFETFRTFLHLRPRSIASQQPASGKVRSLSSGKAALQR
jgi:hypothetical protein